MTAMTGGQEERVWAPPLLPPGSRHFTIVIASLIAGSW